MYSAGYGWIGSMVNIVKEVWRLSMHTITTDKA